MTSTERTGLDDVVALAGFQTAIGAWARDTFPNHTASSIAAHLNEEAHELLNVAIGVKDPPIQPELADVFILLATLADHLDVSLADAVRDKHAVNVGRRWAMGPGGYNKHVEDDARNEAEMSEKTIMGPSNRELARVMPYDILTARLREMEDNPRSPDDDVALDESYIIEAWERGLLVREEQP